MKNKAVSIVLAVTALVCSRVWFTFVDDPEGPNLLIVVGLAMAIYLASRSAYLLKKSPMITFLLAVCIQVIVGVVLYLLL